MLVYHRYLPYLVSEGSYNTYTYTSSVLPTPSSTTYYLSYTSTYLVRDTIYLPPIVPTCHIPVHTLYTYWETTYTILVPIAYLPTSYHYLILAPQIPSIHSTWYHTSHQVRRPIIPTSTTLGQESHITYNTRGPNTALPIPNAPLDTT